MAKKRLASDAELDNENIGAPARDSKRVRAESNVHDVTLSTPNQPQFGRSLDSFPPSNQPLPANISMTALCREFPNHLVGKTLTRLIEAGWKPHQMYCAMDPAAQKGLANEKPWEVLQARWNVEKRRLGQRKKSTSIAIDLARGTRKPCTTDGQMNLGDQTSRSKLSPDHKVVAQGAEHGREDYNDDSSDDGNEDKKEAIQSDTDLSVSELENLFRREMQTQQDLICGPAGSLSPSEVDQRMEDIWITRAREWATSFMRAAKISEQDIPSAQSTVFEHADLQNSILKRVVHEAHPIPKNTDSKELYSYFETVARNVLYSQVQILRVWTQEWEQNSPPNDGRSQEDRDTQGGRHARDESETPESAQDKPEVASQPQGQDSAQPFHDEQTSLQMLEDFLLNNDAQINGPTHRQSRSTPYEQVQQDHQAPQNLQEQSEPISNGRLQSEGWGARQHPYPYPYPHPQQAPLQAQQPGPQVSHIHTAQPDSQPYGIDHSHSQGSRIYPASGRTDCVSDFAPGRLYPNSTSTASMSTGVQRQQPSNSGGLVMGARYHQQPDNSQSVSNLGNQQPAAQNGQVQPKTNRRGAPRRRMFIQAPSRDGPLPQSALDDEDVILNQFPEHLSHSVIMRRFVASSTTYPGGYPTGDMVKALQQHTINGDQDSLTDHQRKAKIRRWVTKEKDSCNKKLKEGLVPSFVPPSMIASSAAAQHIPQATSGVAAFSTALQSGLLSLPSMTAASGTSQIGLQAPTAVPSLVDNHTVAHSTTLASFNSAAATFGATRAGNVASLGPYATSILPSSLGRVSQQQTDPEFPSPASRQQFRPYWQDMEAEEARIGSYAMTKTAEAGQRNNVYLEGEWNIGNRAQASDSTYLAATGIIEDTDGQIWGL